MILEGNYRCETCKLCPFCDVGVHMIDNDYNPCLFCGDIKIGCEGDRKFMTIGGWYET